MPDLPPALYLPDGSSVVEFDEEPWVEIERDPRGVLLMWEGRKRGAKYLMGLDTAEGITGWSRGSRHPKDKEKDNSVIQVFEISGHVERKYVTDPDGTRRLDIDPVTKQTRLHYKDVQVAEFAAPCDPVEAARIANIIGRIYHDDEGEPCELIWEAWPGCGILCTQELLRLGYPNLWHWQRIADAAEDTSALGWRSSHESQKVLWMRSRRHLMQENAIIRSKWLREEYSTAEINFTKMRAMASSGSHDDRMMAANLCFWAGHKWTYEIEEDRAVATETPKEIDYQNRAPVLGDDDVSWEEWKANATADW